MTIGIAAFGPNAGLAILEALKAVEKIGIGAIGGFVSLVAIDTAGHVVRAETQVGGVNEAAFINASASLHSTHIAALMSSGPNRPAPLSQFTPADANVGVLTGHRLPNTITPDGKALNLEVLDRLCRGESAEEAIANVISRYPDIDGGVIALRIDGEVALGDTRYVARFFDAGRAVLTSEFDPSIKVAVMHNAIQPWQGLALVAAQIAINVMDPPNRFDETVRLRCGQLMRGGSRTAICQLGHEIVITVDNDRLLSGSHDLGLGPRVPFERGGEQVGVAVYEPYLTVSDGKLASIDGSDTFDLPIRLFR